MDVIDTDVLVAFVEARLADTEAWATATLNAWDAEGVVAADTPANPDAILGWCQADRRTITSLRAAQERGEWMVAAGLRLALLHRAALWSHHPDYPRSWTYATQEARG